MSRAKVFEADMRVHYVGITRVGISLAASVARPARCIAILDTSVLCPLLVQDTFLGPIFAICK